MLSGIQTKRSIVNIRPDFVAVAPGSAGNTYEVSFRSLRQLQFCILACVSIYTRVNMLYSSEFTKLSTNLERAWPQGPGLHPSSRPRRGNLEDLEPWLEHLREAELSNIEVGM
jgi:hypothetical protein